MPETRIADFRGEDCPGPLIKAMKALAEARRGDTIVILTTSSRCVEMIKEIVKGLGLGNINVLQKDGYIEIVLEKTAEGGI